MTALTSRVFSAGLPAQRYTISHLRVSVKACRYEVQAERQNHCIDGSPTAIVVLPQETELLKTLRLPQNLRTLTVEPSSPDVCLPAALQRQMAVLPPAVEPGCCGLPFE